MTMPALAINTASGPLVAAPAAGLAPSAMVHFTFWLWIGSDVNETFCQQLTVPGNTTMFEAMKAAAEQDSHYEFSAKEYSFGHYITSIGGYAIDTDKNMYWVLFDLPAAPDVDNKPDRPDLTPVGVDEVIPEEGDHVLFWYRMIPLSSHA